MLTLDSKRALMAEKEVLAMLKSILSIDFGLLLQIISICAGFHFVCTCIGAFKMGSGELFIREVAIIVAYIAFHNLLSEDSIGNYYHVYSMLLSVKATEMLRWSIARCRTREGNFLKKFFALSSDEVEEVAAPEQKREPVVTQKEQKQQKNEPVNRPVPQKQEVAEQSALAKQADVAVAETRASSDDETVVSPYGNIIYAEGTVNQ